MKGHEIWGDEEREVIRWMDLQEGEADKPSKYIYYIYVHIYIYTTIYITYILKSSL